MTRISSSTLFNFTDSFDYFVGNLKKGILILLFCLFSCFEKRENVVYVNNIDDRIYIGMTKEDLKREIGEPADSITSKFDKYMFMYYTNDFSDYRLHIYFDEDVRVKSYHID